MTSSSYCNRCGTPHDDGECGRPMTVAEQLDAAQTGEEFGAVIVGLFGSLENAIRTSQDDDLHTDE